MTSCEVRKVGQGILRNAAVAISCALSWETHALAQAAAPTVDLNPAPLQQFGQTLQDNGVTIISRYRGESAANPIGGQRQGAEFAGELNLGANFDLEKMVGLNGGSMQVMFTERMGNNLSGTSINNSVAVQEIWGDGQTYQLTYLTYTQKLFNDAVEIKVGRMDIYPNMVLGSLYCDFESTAFCAAPDILQFDGNVGASYYPLPVWGGRVIFNFTPNFYLKTGIFQNAPNLNPVKDHGFDWSTNDSDGVQASAVFGYSATQPGADTPDQYDVGVVVSRSHFSSPWYNANQPQQFGQTLIFVQAQKLLYQPVADAPQGLYGFGFASVGTNAAQQSGRFALGAGAIYKGIIPSRPLDYAGIGISDLRYTDSYLNYLYAQRVANGGTERPNSNMMMMELDYTAQLTPWLNVMPNVQYIVHPDGLGGLGYPRSNLPNAFVVGLQFQVGLATLLGFPGLK
jgi:porin